MLAQSHEDWELVVGLHMGKADIPLNEKGRKFFCDDTAASPKEQRKTTEPAAPDDALVQAPSALLMEASTGTVIYEKIRIPGEVQRVLQRL